MRSYHMNKDWNTAGYVPPLPHRHSSRRYCILTPVLRPRKMSSTDMRWLWGPLSSFKTLSNQPFLVHVQITLTILLYGCESHVYSRARHTTFNYLPFSAPRQVVHTRSSFSPRVLEPSEMQCSNSYLMQLAYTHVLTLMAPSQRIISSIILYLGHIQILWNI